VAYDASDSVLYRGLANNLVEHGTFSFHGHATAYVTPAYPLFLVLLRPIGTSTLFLAVVQCFLGAFTVGLLADTARRLAGPIAGWVAGLLAAGYPHLIFWTGYVLTETLFVCLVALAVWVTVVLLQRDESPAWLPVSAGAAYAAAGLARPEIFGFAVLLGLAGLASKRWRFAAFLGFVGLVLLWSPWVLRNAVTLHAFVPASTETGIVLYQGNSPGATGGSRGYVDGRDFKTLDRLTPLPEVEEDREYRKAALTWMRHHPGEVVRLAPKKLANMFRPVYAGSSKLNLTVTLLSYPLVLTAGAVGTFLLARRRRVTGLVVVWLLVYELVVHALVTGMIRFRLPVEAMLCVTAGVAAQALWTHRIGTVARWRSPAQRPGSI
jgi:4-amino-4-deoxy-L-arabinose transferase-like glycosyltransferase